jgi:hypothetical protein
MSARWPYIKSCGDIVISLQFFLFDSATTTSAPTSAPKPPPKKPKKPSSGTGGETGSSGGETGSSGNSQSSTSGTGDGDVTSGGSGTVSSASGALVPAGQGPARTGTFVMLGVAAVAGVAIAAVAVPKRRVETPDHPLKGALNRRINLFSHLANHANDQTFRPPRRGDEGGYVNADEIIV